MIFPFLVSFLSFVHISVGGDIYISELLLAAYLIFSAGKLHLLSDHFPKKIIVMGLLWLISQMLSDWYRGSSSENYLRGWASIIFFIIDFCAVYIMARLRPDVVRVLILGTALGTIFSVFYLPTDYSEAEPWKFGYGPPVIMLSLLYLSTGNRHQGRFAPLFLIGLGVLSVILNARSMGGTLMLTAAIIFLGQSAGFKTYTVKKISPAKLAGMVAGGVVVVFSIATMYQWAAESDYLPDNVIEKYKMAKGKNNGLLGMIAGGRPEILISSQAVMDSPIFGHGSWAEDRYYTNMMYDAAYKLGLDVDEAHMKYNVEMSNLIPTHSVLMQAWVWAGILGAIFWLFVIQLLLRKTFDSFFVSYKLKSLVIYLGLSSVWSVLFSPFGANARFSWAVAIIVIFFASHFIPAKSAIQPQSRKFEHLRFRKIVSK